MTTESRLRRLGVQLYRKGIVQTGEFRLKVHDRLPEAPLSPIYINLRVAPRGELTALLITEIAREFRLCAQRRELAFFHVVGLPTAAEPLAESFVFSADLPADRLLRMEKGEAGGKRKIASIVHGSMQAGAACLMLDDVVTAADSKLEAAQALREKGLVVTDCLVVVDREGGGMRDLAKNGIQLHSLFTLSGLLSLLEEEEEITPDEGRRVASGIQELNAYLEAHPLS